MHAPPSLSSVRFRRPGGAALVALVTLVIATTSLIATPATSVAAHLPAGPVGRIVFSGDTGSFGNVYLYTMAEDGSDVRQLTPTVCEACGDTATDAHARWSPDGSRVVFQSDRDTLSSATQIYSVAANGKGLTKLTEKASNFRPLWSPDGSSIVFESTRTGDHEIFVMAADGSGESNVSQDGGVDRSPTWSPDGQQLAFLSNRDGDWDIYVVEANGSEPLNVSDDGVAQGPPVWSPDGALIAFPTMAADWDIAVATPDGATITPTAEAVDVDETAPAWSPDASKIAFRYDDGLNPELAVMDANGANSHGVAGWYADDVDAIGVTWSADAQRIAYSEGSAISAVDVDGTNQSTLIFEIGDSYRFPDWQALHVSVELSSPAIDYNDAVTVTAHLHWYASATNQELSIYRRPIGGSTTLLATGVVDGAGNLVAVFTPKKNTSLFVTWGGDDDHPAATSGTVGVGVRVLVTTRVRGAYGKAGGWLLVHRGAQLRQIGTVVPNHAGDPLTFEAQVRRSGTWRGIARARFRLRKNGSVTVVLTITKRGYYRVRAVFTSDTDHLGAASAWRMIRVTA